MDCRCYSAASRLEVLLDEDDFRSSSRARERGSSASFTTACDSPGPLKSILCSSFWPTNTGLPVPGWSFSTCLGVNTQRFVDSCPHTRLSVLVGSVTLVWEYPCSGIASSTKCSLNSCSHSGISELARPESANSESPSSLLGFLFIWFWIFIGLVNIGSPWSLINHSWHSYWRDVILSSILSFSNLNFTHRRWWRRAGRICWAMTHFPVLKVSLKLMSQI